MVECDLLQIESLDSESRNKKRYGRYHGSCFWDIKKFGSKKWVIGAYVDVFNQELFDHYEDDELLMRCLEYLNRPPPRKKYAKKNPKPKYGNLEHYRSRVIEKDGRKYISALLIVDSRKSKLFWGKGRNV
tara:strand:+ start:127 stop:516 length:390 start_codon:yes stop_codon:yes gene_type:complete